MPGQVLSSAVNDDVATSSSGADEDEDVIVLPRRNLVNETSSIRLEEITFDSDGDIKPDIKLSMKQYFPGVDKQRYPSTP